MKILFIAGADQKYGTFQISKLLLDTVRQNDNKMEYIVLTQKSGPLNEWCDANSILNYVYPYRYCVYYPSNNLVKGYLKHFAKYLLVTASNRIALHKLEKSGVLNGIDIVHTNINRDLFGILIAKKYNLPNVTHLREFSRAHFGLKPIYHNQIELMNKYSSRFIAISNVVKDDWIDYGIRRDKIEVIYDGVDVDRYKVAQIKEEKSTQLRMVMCGAIYKGKGQKELIEAVGCLLKEGYCIRVDIYGNVESKEYFNELNGYIKSQDIQTNIRFLGYKDNVNEVLSDYDVGVVCSKAEGFGLVTVEYMLSRLIIIASETGANPELLEHGKWGILYPLGDIEQLKKSIKEVYSNKLMYSNKRNLAIKYAKDTYSIKKTAARVRDMYLLAIGDK